MLPIHEQLDLWAIAPHLSPDRSPPALAEEKVKADLERLLHAEAFRWLATFDGGNRASI